MKNCIYFNGDGRDLLMKKKLFINKVKVEPSTIHGYGVFADKYFKKGELIEECHVLLGDGKDEALANYYYASPAENISLIPLGFGLIYNHSPHPNAKYTYDAERKIFIYTASRKINLGEEILVSYGDEWFSDRPFKIRMPSRSLRRLLNPASSICMRALIVMLPLVGLQTALRYMLH